MNPLAKAVLKCHGFTRMIRFSHHRSTSESLQEYGRGIAGGLMFSIPLLYTMEVWWAGFMLHPGRILIYVIVTFALLLLYNRFAGLRRDASFTEVVIDSVEELGIGLVLSAVILWLAGRIGWEMDRYEILGKIVMEAMTVAIGVTVGTAQLGAPDDGDEGLSGDGDESDSSAYFPQLALALCGAVLFAANVAPTDEISVIAMESTPVKLLLFALASILLGSLVLHFSNFRGSSRYVVKDTPVLAARGIFTTYAVALLAAAGSLWFFGKLDGEPFSQCLG
ncbi:MAG: TIGR02587 family membrane protein, partial [Verrucomicrobiaceae bacterium]